MNQLCKVCSEPAAGFHFGAFTCEGCKSFFGRTYNNLSQIHECKNGGQCVINKQNRTSCKACRLRKCFMEQANMSSPPSFRSPVTPTLQDGSLPFVSTHLREGVSTDEPSSVDLKTDPTDLSRPIVQMAAGSSLPTHSGAMDLRLQELASSVFHSNAKSRHPSTSQLEGAYRQHVLEAIRKSHQFPISERISDPVPHSQRTESSDCVRRAGDYDSRFSSLPFTEWGEKIKEPSCLNNNLLITHEKGPQSPHNSSVVSLSPEGGSEGVEDGRTSREEKQKFDNINENKQDVVFSVQDAKKTSFSDNVMTEEERLLFLKSVNKPFVLNSSPNRTFPPSYGGVFRFPVREELFYTSINNNIIHFPPYPPIWPPMLPFSPFPKCYPPFNPMPTHSIPECLKVVPVPCHGGEELRREFKKEDPLAKKQYLDAILEVQRENLNPLTSPCSIAAHSHACSKPPDTDSEGEKPMDLSVRRKRKLDKSEIIYKPGEEEEEIISETKEKENLKTKEVKKETNEGEKEKYEIPAKFIKLEEEGVEGEVPQCQ